MGTRLHLRAWDGAIWRQGFRYRGFVTYRIRISGHWIGVHHQASDPCHWQTAGGRAAGSLSGMMADIKRKPVLDRVVAAQADLDRRCRAARAAIRKARPS